MIMNNEMKLKKTIFFDFDGTIADSENVLFEVVNEISPKFGYKQVKKNQIQDMKKMTISMLMKKYNVSYLKLPFILRDARKVFRQRITKVLPFVGMKEVLRQLSENGHKILIVTTNKKETVEKFLSINKIDVVKSVVGESSLFGKAKALKKVIKKENLEKSKALYVGDEVRDIEAAKKAGLVSIAVSWGFNSPDILKKSNPDYLVDNPKELLAIFG